MPEIKRPDDDFGNKLLKILEEIPALQDGDARNRLLRGLPQKPVSAIQRNPACLMDLNNIVTAAEGLGQLKSSCSTFSILNYYNDCIRPTQQNAY